MKSIHLGSYVCRLPRRQAPIQRNFVFLLLSRKPDVSLKSSRSSELSNNMVVSSVFLLILLSFSHTVIPFVSLFSPILLANASAQRTKI